MGNFEIDDDGYVVVYVDGSCINNGRHGAKAGIGVFFSHNNYLNVSEPAIGRQTNINAEIQAVRRAAEIAYREGFRSLRIYTDSDYAIKSLHYMVKFWLHNGWRKSNGQPVENKQEIQKMDSAMKMLQVDLQFVHSHCGHYGNEQADRLAKQGAQGY